MRRGSGGDLARHLLDTGGRLDEEFLALGQEQTMIGDAGNLIELGGEFIKIVILDGNIDQQMAVVGQEKLTVERAPRCADGGSGAAPR